MKIIHPDNFFFNILFSIKEIQQSSSKTPSMLLSKKLIDREADAAFIPVMDLVTHSDFYVSKKIGFGFDGDLSDTFIYYKAGEDDFDTINLSGDVSTTESLLLKFLMKENYEKDIKLQILDPQKSSEEISLFNLNILISGDDNFVGDRFLKGVSFSDEIIETFEIPYIKYLLCANSEEKLHAAENLFENVEEKFFSYCEQKKWENPFSQKFQYYFEENFSRIVLELTPDDIDAALQLVRMPYYHGMVDEIKEIKFI